MRVTLIPVESMIDRRIRSPGIAGCVRIGGWGVKGKGEVQRFALVLLPRLDARPFANPIGQAEAKRLHLILNRPIALRIGPVTIP